MSDRPAREHTRPPGADDGTVEALGTLSEALEVVEQARGHLYAFHQLIGKADRTLGDAVDGLRAAGHAALADDIEHHLVGRNVLEGRWTFQVVEEFDDGYWSAFRRHERTAREVLVEGRRHLNEAEMKERLRTRGHPDHTARPGR
ncbi:MAG TPA: hypothetical protein VK908_17385 [Jiangellales bacterium]|nr:hypothetical protein [Jiangellales bacterium]